MVARGVFFIFFRKLPPIFSFVLNGVNIVTVFCRADLRGFHPLASVFLSFVIRCFTVGALFFFAFEEAGGFVVDIYAAQMRKICVRFFCTWCFFRVEKLYRHLFLQGSEVDCVPRTRFCVGAIH